MKIKLFRYFYGLLIFVISSYANDNMTSKFASILQHCINDDASYTKLYSLAKLYEWKELPTKYNKIIAAEEANDTKTFMINVSKDKKSFLSLIIQKPDVCTISYSSNNTESIHKIEKIILESFKFNKLIEKKVGLQTTTSYSLNQEKKIKLVSSKYILNNLENTYAISLFSENNLKNVNTKKTIEVDSDNYFNCSNNELLFKVMKSDNSITLKHIWNKRLSVNKYIKKNMMSYKYHNELDTNYSLTFDSQSLKLYHLDFPKAIVNCKKIVKSEYENYGLNLKH